MKSEFVRLAWGINIFQGDEEWRARWSPWQRVKRIRNVLRNRIAVREPCSTPDECETCKAEAWVRRHLP